MPDLCPQDEAALAAVEMELAAEIFATENRAPVAADATAAGTWGSADGRQARSDTSPAPVTKNRASLVSQLMAKELWKGAKLKLHVVLLATHVC